VERERLVPLVAALLAVLALAVGAATLDSATGGPIAGSDEGPGVGDGADQGDLGAPPPPDDEETSEFLPQWVAQLLVALVFAAGVVALLAWIRREGLDAVKTVALLVFLTTGLFVLVFYLLELLASASRPEGRGGLLGRLAPRLPGGGGSGGGSGEVSQVATEPSALVFAVLALVLVGAVAVAVRSTSEPADEASETETADDPDPSVAAVGAAAGRAADRIEASGDVENAVYRAWREMTDPLDLPRETTTPGEFAAAAVDAGMAREDVTELTRLFETTRYGGVAVDEDREHRARSALRRIERAYGGDE
jgi:hypothetical protein